MDRWFGSHVGITKIQICKLILNTQEFKYTGTGNLEVMQEAVNYNAFLASLVLKQAPALPGNLLDIGAGIGVYARLVQRAGYSVSCLEPDLYQAKRLRDDGFPVYTSIEELANQQFDFMYAFNVLEHIENDAEALLSWKEKLMPGGKLLLYVPAFNILFSAMDQKVGHFRRYRRKDLTRKILSAGLTPVYSARYADSLGFFATLVYKLLDKGNGDLNRKSLLFYDRVFFPVSRIGDFFFRKLFGKNVFILVEKK